MTPPGRKPKPTATKKLGGNPGKRRLNESEPAYAPASARLPSGKLPKEAAALWRALAPQLAAAGVLKQPDRPALEMLCLHYAVVRAALAQMLKDGRVEVENAEGQLFTVSDGELAIVVPVGEGFKKHPAATVLRENSLAFKSYLAEFGLTPSSRVRIHVDTGEREQSLAEALFAAASGSEAKRA
jgi:P27 family predicted phage terminase small subunit